MNEQYFHFTLGPVQGFVAQARRTRDFWAGSFILSWLSAVAIKATEQQSGKVIFPEPDPVFMSWLTGENSGEKPRQGSIPNRFKAAVDGEFKPSDVTDAVTEAWTALAKCIWDRDLESVASSSTKEIWDRQVAGFWEMSWAISPDESDSAVIDKRKNWRSHVLPDEQGVKCSVMDGWQELSAVPYPDREKMNAILWSVLRDRQHRGMKSDLKENEALCAPAFIKRRFSRHFHEFNSHLKQVEQLSGWRIPSAVPSVSYMGAVHWLEKVLKKADGQRLDEFHIAAHALVGDYGEWDSNIKCLDEARGNRELKALDGNVFFDTMLENPNIFEDQKQAALVQAKLLAVRKSADLPEPTPFYAVLMMDGDSLGIHMSDPKKQSIITKGLADFTRAVKDIVYKHNGFLVYAGGDDVLATLPLEDAIACATEIRACYLGCFDRSIVPTTLSGAIEFAHVKMPLTKVLKDAHGLLDDVAKDGSGRDALAIRVWKPGGLQIEWSQPWAIALEDGEEGQRVVLDRLAEIFQDNEAKEEGFSSKFFFKIRERFSLLNPVKDKQGNYGNAVLNEVQAIDLLTMEYLNSWGNSKNKNVTQAKEQVGRLLNQCNPRKRDAERPDSPEKWPPVHGEHAQQWLADGALLLRFLARKGVE